MTPPNLFGACSPISDLARSLCCTLIAVAGCTPVGPKAMSAQCPPNCSAEVDGTAAGGGAGPIGGDGAPVTVGGAAAANGGAAAANGGTAAANGGAAAASGDAAIGGGAGVGGGDGSFGAAGSNIGAGRGGPNGAGGPQSMSPTCGNGMIDENETCDPIAMCPTAETCVSPDPCLAPMLTGSPSTCNSECEQLEITACTPGDRCCPKDCNNATDSDCSVSCGDGVVTGGETCEAMDPARPCPESCDDMDPCTMDIKTGTPQQCNVVCTHMPVTAPRAGDKCCPAGANAANDSDCMTKCGDGVVTGNETCDPQGPTPCETRNSCQPNGCMGATFSGDPASCTAKCERKMITARQGGDNCCPSGANQANDSDCPQKCGDGVRTGSEVCDPCESPLTCVQIGCASADYQGSASDCTGRCVRGTVTQAKGGDNCCPRGANLQTDSDCSPSCGDGVVSSNETCDNGSRSPTPCVTESACMASATSSGGCPSYSGAASLCTAKCDKTGSRNRCGGCEDIPPPSDMDCKGVLPPSDRDTCLVAAWLCLSQVQPGGDPDTVVCSCLMRM